MSRQSTENLHDFLISKDMSYSVRLTSYTHGTYKKMFMKDCVQRDWNESKMINHILESYYSINSNQPTLTEGHMEHFRKVLMDKIDLEKERENRQTRIDLPNT